MSDDDKKPVRVTSYNQMGGITAQTVNMRPEPRHLNGARKSDLLALLGAPNDREFTIDSPAGDDEALTLALEVEEFLKASGFRLAENGSTMSMRVVPWNKGVGVNANSNPIRISVGPQ